MSKKMLEYIRHQPQVLKRIICSRKDYLKALTEKCVRKPYDRIILVGSGSSYNSCMIAKPMIEKFYRHEVTVLLPTSDIAFICSNKEKTLILAVSQEGTSSNTYAFVKKAREYVPNASVFAVSSAACSNLAGICEATIIVGCGDETVGPKTVGVTSTVLTLWLTALELVRMENRITEGEYNEIIEDLTEEIRLMPDNIIAVEKWISSNKEFWANAGALAFLAQNRYLGIISESALKIDETLYIPSLAYDFEEFLHGPFCLFERDGLHCIILCGPDDDLDRTIQLEKFADEKNIPCILAGSGNSVTHELDIEMKIKNSGYAVFALLLPAQFAAAIVSEHMGQPVDAHDFIGFSKMMKSKL